MKIKRKELRRFRDTFSEVLEALKAKCDQINAFRDQPGGYAPGSMLGQADVTLAELDVLLAAPKVTKSSGDVYSDFGVKRPVTGKEWE